jgi:predicted Zn-dependent protease
MQQESASFWADIKACEEQLAANPHSFCFARLAEIYLKVGLVDDALHVARQGVARHPSYVAGQRALALACHARGLTEECRVALERVTTAVPEDLDAQKMLGRLYVEAGNDGAAVGALRTALEFHAGDVESRVELEAIERSAAVKAAEAGAVASPPVHDVMDAGFVPFDEDMDDEGEVIEEVEVLDIDEADLIEEEPAAIVLPEADLSPAQASQDPFFTSTLAELYVQQGFASKALDIYRTILAADPANSVIQARIAELEAGGAVPEEPQQEGAPSDAGEAFREPLFSESPVHEAVSGAASAVVAGVPPRGEADGAVAVLEGWLENIGRMKACR